jgi:hypothetical protein
MKRLILAACLSATGAVAEPLYPDAVVSNDLAFFDPFSGSTFACLRTLPTEPREMPDKRSDQLMVDGVRAFSMHFLDGLVTEIWLHPDIPEMQAELFATKVGEAYGRIPSFLRENIPHVTVNAGNEAAFADVGARVFTLYAENIDISLSERDLEAILFQEAVHAGLDVPLTQSAEWLAAQAADDGAVTEIASGDLAGEDLAESAIFAYAVLMAPGQLPAGVETAVRATIPNRLAFFEKLFAAHQPMFAGPVDLPACLP